MSHALDIITDVRDQIAVDPDCLADARARRDVVLSIAGKFPGALRTTAQGRSRPDL
jgi:hypothetical protein